MQPLVFSPATADHARFVARHVLEALHWHMYDEPLNAEQRQSWDELTAVCRRDDVLYSYKHALLAKIGGEPVGLILAYDGANYHPLRTRTFALLPAFAGMDVDSMEDEAVAGEYYIDSLAVTPEKAWAPPSLPKPWRKPHNSDCAPPCWSIPTTPLRADSTRPAASARAEPSPLSGKPICACRPKCSSLFKKNPRAFIPTTE